MTPEDALAIMNGATDTARKYTAMYWAEDIHRTQLTPDTYTLADYLDNYELATSADINESWRIMRDESDLECAACIDLTQLAPDMTVTKYGKCDDRNCGRHEEGN